MEEGGAVILGEYKKYNQRLKVRFRCYCGVETSKRFEMLHMYEYPYCNKCAL